MKYIIIILLLPFLSLSIKAGSCSLENNISRNEGIKKQGQQAKDLDIYLLIGQSNMAGRAPFGQTYSDTLDNVFLFVGRADKEWEGAANPLNKYSTVRKNLSMQKMDMGYSFAQKMAESFSGRSIGLVVNARGGTSIDLWMPGEDLYIKAVERAKAAMKFGNLKGILWHQGEGDVSKYKEYMPKLLVLIKALRHDLGKPDLPFVAGQLSTDKPVREGFNQMILTLPDKISNAAVVSSDSTSTIDNTHFDAKSQYLLGNRYAEKMKRLLNKEMESGETNATLSKSSMALTSGMQDGAYNITLPRYISSNMVFQQQTPVKFWGETVPESTIIATLENSSKTLRDTIFADADGYGKWNVEFPEQKAGFDPYTITFMIKNRPESKVQLDNVLCGDVWFVGGQSNMQKKAGYLPDGEQVAATANDYPEIRSFRASYQLSDIPLETVNPSSGSWFVCDSANTADNVSAVAYIYARELALDQNIPIGLLQSYRGGTEIETWMSPDIINTEHALHKVRERRDSKDPNANDARNNFPSINYNGQINPLIKYPIKGFIFYQGESNTKRALEYKDMMQYLIKDWREKWNMGNLPFYYVQLFNMGVTDETLYEESNWADLRNQQLELLNEDIDNIGMVVTIDTNEDPNNPVARVRIHPRNKKPVGHRLALLSRELCYSEAITGISPFPKANYVRNDTVFVVFSNVGAGLKTLDNSDRLKGFVIADKSRNFKRGVASILNDSTVIVTSTEISKPAAVRYGWAKNPDCNLANSGNLPASPFKTDDWKSLYKYEDY